MIEAFRALLAKLKEQRRSCPYCGGEYVCDEGCVLKPYWFERCYCTRGEPPKGDCPTHGYPV